MDINKVAFKLALILKKLKIYLTTILLFFIVSTNKSQIVLDLDNDYSKLKNIKVSQKCDTIIVVTSVCRLKEIIIMPKQAIKETTYKNSVEQISKQQNIIPFANKRKFLTVSGNLLFNLNYQSF